MIAIDPGLTTGIAIGHIDAYNHFVLETCHVVTWDQRFDRLWRLLEAQTTVIIESFNLFEHHKNDQVGSSFPSSQVIGIVEAFCWHQGITDVVFQTPASRIKVAILPQHESIVGKVSHCKAAYQHLRLYAVTHCHAKS